MTPDNPAAGEPKPLLLGLGWYPGAGGGLSRHFRDLVVALAADGGPKPAAVIVGPAPGAPEGLHAVSNADDATMRRIVAMARGARQYGRGAEVVDVHFAFYATLARLLPSLRRLPLAVHFQGPWAAESAVGVEVAGWRIKAKELVERRMYRRAREVAVLSGAFKQILVERYGIAPWRIEVIAPGVDLEAFSPGDRSAARAALGVDRDAWVALTVRRLVPRTGVDVLLDAWAQLDDPKRVLLVPSGGAARPALEAQVERLGLGDHVRFLGVIDDETLVACYRAADVSVVPTVALEGFGLVVLESLACGTAVVATDAGGLGEAVAPLDPGLVVPAGDVAALARRLDEANRTGNLPSPEECRSFAERYSWPAVVARHRALYRRAVQPPAADERPLRVVYVDHTAVISGAELSMLRQIPAIEGIDAHMILGAAGPLVARLLGAGVSVEILPMPERARGLHRERVQPRRLPLASAAGTAAYVLRLARRLRRLRPDVVHTCSLKSSLYGAAAARLARVPVVWEVQDRIEDDYLPPSAVRLVRAMSRRLPDEIIANSEATGATLPEPRAPLTVIPLPVPRPAPATDAVRIQEGPLHVGILGRLSPWKGQDTFLTAFAKAFPDGDERAVIIGSTHFGEEGIEDGLRRLAVELGIAHRVELRGHRDDIEAELRRLDVLVHAARIPEPFGMVVTEGMAAGLPVVAPNVGGPAEVIHDRIDGLLYPMNDVAALAELLGQLASDPALRARLGAAGRRRARDYYPDVLGPRYLEVYRRLARRDSR